MIRPGVGLVSETSLAVSRLPIARPPEPAPMMISPSVVLMVSLVSAKETKLSGSVV